MYRMHMHVAVCTVCWARCAENDLLANINNDELFCVTLHDDDDDEQSV